MEYFLKNLGKTEFSKTHVLAKRAAGEEWTVIVIITQHCLNTLLLHYVHIHNELFLIYYKYVTVCVCVCRGEGRVGTEHTNLGFNQN